MARRMQAEPETNADRMRRAIRDSGLTHYALAQLAKIDRKQIDRFMSGERSPTLDTADRLAAALGLELQQRKGYRPGHARP
jgi:plasmid maintenance system antidote protein VapI